MAGIAADPDRAVLVVTGPNSPNAGETIPMSFDTALAGSGIVAASISGSVADALFAVIGEPCLKLMEQGVIEVAPLAFMRGRTLNDAFVILDEAQNTTSEQMKMFLTRLGFGSKAVITGDITQIDLPSGRVSGLVEALRVVKAVEGIAFITFDDRDVVRHKLVQQIVKAYDAYTSGSRGGDGSTT